MHIALLSGSHRTNSQSARVAKYLAARLPQLNEAVKPDIIDLAGNPLPLWDEGMWDKSGTSPIQQQWKPYSERLRAADGFVVIAPEWNGMVPSGLLNFLMLCGPEDVGHKPALITTVSASINGVHPVHELRGNGYKNNRLCFIPEHLIIRNVAKVFEGEQPAGPDDEYIRGRADFALKILLEYVKGLKLVRASGTTFDQRFANGM